MDFATLHLILQDVLALGSVSGIGTLIFKIARWQQNSDDRHKSHEKELNEHKEQIGDLYDKTGKIANGLANTRGQLGLNGG